MIGQLLNGRYRIIQTLGSGGMAQTYVAEDTHRPGTPRCVVKQIKPITQNPKAIATARNLFNREAKILGELGNHPQIPHLLAHFEQNQQFYLIQEYIEGYPLSAEMQPGQRWSEPEVIQLLEDVLEILTFVHGKGVIHRDIKPDNLIRRTDGKLVLIDFGAVQEVKAQLATVIPTQSNMGIGTYGYMPTEQAQGKPRPNSDIYALGIVGIQALTGLMPSQLPDDPESGELHWQHFVPVSQDLAMVLTKMVRYHFRDRYQTTKEALGAMEFLVDPLTVTLPGFSSPKLSLSQHNQTLDGTLSQPSAPSQLEPSKTNNDSAKNQSKTAKKSKKTKKSKKWLLATLGALVAMTGLAIGTRDWSPLTAQSNTLQVQSPIFGDGVLDLGVVTTTYNPSEAYIPLVKHLESELSKQLERKVTIKLHTIDWQETEFLEQAKTELKKKNWDLVFANGALVSASAAIDNDYQFVARMFPQVPQLESVLFVRADSPISSIKDLSTQTKIALGELNYATGFTMPVYDLYGKKVSLDLNNNPTEIIKKVTSRQADVGAAPYQIIANNPDLQKQFRVIHRSRGIPLPGVFLSPNLNQQEQDFVKAVLLNAPEKLQAQAQYGESEVVNYQHFNGIKNKVEEFLGCGDLTQNPVQLWCPEAIVGQIKEYNVYSSETFALKLQTQDGQFYRLVLPRVILKQDADLPSSLPGFYGKTIVVSQEVMQKQNGTVKELIVSQPGQLIVRD